MKNLPTRVLVTIALAAVPLCLAPAAQAQEGPVAHFAFDGTVGSQGSPTSSFVAGLAGQALRLGGDGESTSLVLPSDLMSSEADRDFSLRFWVRTDAAAERRFVVLSQKEFRDNSLASQKNPGWAFYMSHGTWAWSVGSGSRRLTYERDNGQRMPLNDGRWHQLAMTYSAGQSEIRLFYDGVDWVTYHVSDADGFDFSNSNPTTVGWEDLDGPMVPDLLPAIESGAERLQALVDAFNDLGERPIESDEFLRLIVDPSELFEERAGREVDEGAWGPIAEAEAALMQNPYTIHQALEFMEAARLTQIYSLIDGEVVIRRDVAARYAARERLSTPDFDMDELTIWDRVLTPAEVRDSYGEYFEPTAVPLAPNLRTLTAAAWNIWHGGSHFTAERHGWDSRVRVAEMLEAEGVDVVMMQETYSSGDFIAAELGYYLATTVDWDYLNQGANISVLSRYPIREVHVQEDSPFNNVGTRVQVSASQDLYVMSNWYGMNQFPAVFDFHRPRFDESGSIPVLFGGDFNAVPHTDGGDSPASVALLDEGFTDAFRSLFPDVEERPGATHRNGRRIDQLYYKGAGLTNTSTRVISTWNGGFPSDHFMILSRFDLDYATRDAPSHDAIGSAEALGATYPRPETVPGVPPLLEDPTGSPERVCVDVTREMTTVRSGEMIIGGVLSRLQADGPNKLWWKPLESSLDMTIEVSGRSLDGVEGSVEFEIGPPTAPYTNGRTPRQIPEEAFFPGGARFPAPGRWIAVASSGRNWGCFVFHVPSEPPPRLGG